MWRRRGRRRQAEVLMTLHDVIEPEVARLVGEGVVSGLHAREVAWETVTMVLKEHLRRGRYVRDYMVRPGPEYRHMIVRAARARDPHRTLTDATAARREQREALREAIENARRPDEREALTYLLRHGGSLGDTAAFDLARSLARRGRLDEDHMRAARVSYDRRMERAVRGDGAWPNAEDIVATLFST